MAIVLLTDFGVRDHYVAVMKGVIKSIFPAADIIDLSHEVPPQDVASGAYLLGVSYRYFPEGSIFVAVVDPGVGTERKGILVSASRYFFIGPDNGLFTLVLEREKEFSAWELKNKAYFRKEVSHTFHGRDIFAPVAAHLAKGVEPSSFGPKAKEIVRLPWPKIKKDEKIIVGTIIYVDRFGNLITNIHETDLAGKEIKKVSYKGLEIPFLKTYGLAPKGTPLSLIGSEGYLEIAVSEGSALARFGKEGQVYVELA
ncbi:SAM hydrolase/SAM-dependent halogenase family protein [Thermodesulfatator atlanticus]